MNLSNGLTLLRIVVVPFFLFGLINNKFIFSLIIFVLAVLTDFLDGKIARASNQVTDFGKFLDPIADKILTTCAYLYLLRENLVDIIPVAIIISREFIVSAVRLLASKNGEVMSANFLGKLKTFLQVVSIFLAILFLCLKVNFCLQNSFLEKLTVFSSCFTWAAATLSVVSGVIYVTKCKQY